MEKIKERGKTYALHKASDKLNDYYGSAMLNVVQFDGHNIQCAYIDGYLQAEQDLEVKEVDLEKEFYDFLDTLIGKDNGHLSEDELFRIAEYFYELGLKVQKGG